MNQILSTLWLWVWQLLPANPILLRVVHGASRRVRHLWIRVTYLTALLSVVLFSLVASMSGQSSSLTELAKSASQTFMWASITQLSLMCFLAPVFTASAITQERDAQTFNILLSTPLTSAQIVFGSLMSRLYFVLMLLVAGLPIFLMTMVYGGVTTQQVFESFVLSGSTAILTGALAIFIAMTRAGTRNTIFSFYLIIGLYLLAGYLLGQWPNTWVDASPLNLSGQRMSWLTPLHPFLALDVSLNRIYPPPYSHLANYSSLSRFALAYPATTYVIWTTLLALLMTVLSIFFVRRGIKTGEPTVVSRLFQRFSKKTYGDKTRTPRTVWSNPVAWREAKTQKGSSALMRWSLILGGLAGAIVLFVYHAKGTFSATQIRPWLAALVVVQFALALLIATNTAATSMTKEKESKTMDIMLTTPVTSKYILWGKLRGLVSFAAPLLIGPVLVLMGFGLYGLGSSAPPAVWLETGFELAAMLTIYTACACVIGLRISLASKRNMTAIMYSVGLLIVLCGVSFYIGDSIVKSSGGEFGAAIAPFTPFTAIWYLIDMSALFDTTKSFTANAHSARTAALIGTVFAVVVYTFVVWNVYNGLVRNFDMIMRKQTGG